jgi:hypothetical protein
MAAISLIVHGIPISRSQLLPGPKIQLKEYCQE